MDLTYEKIEKLQEFDFLLEKSMLPTNSDRKNILRNGDKRYRGVAVGFVRSRREGHKLLPSRHLSKPKYIELFKKTAELLWDWDSKFFFTSIQFNQNYVCAKHRDRNNVGDSYIIGLGSYTGGELLVFWDGKDNPPEKVDINHKFFKFNGAEYYHETAPFEGTRWTFVYFNLMKETDEIDINILKNL